MNIFKLQKYFDKIEAKIESLRSRVDSDRRITLDYITVLENRVAQLEQEVKVLKSIAGEGK